MDSTKTFKNSDNWMVPDFAVEQEDKKILYFFPPDKSLNQKLISVGLCEAVISFTSFFNLSCQSVCTKKTKRFMHCLGCNVWIVVVISLPSRKQSDQLEDSETDSINDQVIESVIRTACETFELFNGKVSAIIQSSGFELLKAKMEHFFSRYLRTMLFEHCDILDCFNGIQFMATEPADFARVQGLLNRIQYSFACIEHLAFFYEGRLIHSSLDLSYIRYIYHYLNSFLFIEQPDLTHTMVMAKTKHLGRFLVGPKNLADTNQEIQCPVLCSPNTDLPDCQLITYQSLRAVVCLLVKGTHPVPMEFFMQFDKMVGPRLTLLAQRLSTSRTCSFMDGSIFPLHLMEENSDTTTTLPNISSLNLRPDDGMIHAIEDVPENGDSLLNSPYNNRFIYWNPFTCATMTTLHVFTGSGRRQMRGAKPILEAMVRLRSELMLKPDSWHEEITIRWQTSGWIVCRRSNGREIYMFFPMKHDSLNRVDRCCRRPTLHRNDHSSLLDAFDDRPVVRLDLTSATETLTLLDSGRRICGQGAARANVAILQDKAYFEVKIQISGHWAVGLCSDKANLNSFECLGNDPFSWILRNDLTVWHNSANLGQIQQEIDEGDILGVMYDHAELRFTVNGIPAELRSLNSPRPITGVRGIKGLVYPVVGVSHNAVLDVHFSARSFRYDPPYVGFKEIMVECEII